MPYYKVNAPKYYRAPSRQAAAVLYGESMDPEEAQVEEVSEEEAREHAPELFKQKRWEWSIEVEGKDAQEAWGNVEVFMDKLCSDVSNLEHLDDWGLLEPVGESTLNALLIPDHRPDTHGLYPGAIKPGYYNRNQVVELLREHKNNPAAIQFLADMLEQ